MKPELMMSSAAEAKDVTSQPEKQFGSNRSLDVPQEGSESVEESGVYTRDTLVMPDKAFTPPKKQEFKHEDKVIVQSEVEAALGGIAKEMEKEQEEFDKAEPGSMQRMRATMRLQELRRASNKIVNELTKEQQGFADKFLSKMQALEIKRHEIKEVPKELTEDEKKVLDRAHKEYGSDLEKNPQPKKKGFWDRLKGLSDNTK
jgi:Glu-tRNA(Gln) amidotransferase subunit E-like FAD-binding protein